MAQPARFPRGEVAVVGIGCTPYSRDSGASVFKLASEAVIQAVADAGLTLADVDGLCTFGPNDSISPNLLAQAIGIQSLSYYVDQFFGGSVSLTMIGQATLALAAGVADCVVCYRAINGRSGTRLNGSGRGGGGRLPWDMQFKYSAGVLAPAQEIALVARAHMLKYGTESEDFGRIAVLSRTNALDNERAMMRKPMTLDDYLASRWIVDPFRLLDCCLETDGAVAIVLTRTDRARDLPHRPVLVQGAAWGGGITLINNGQGELTDSPARPIAERLYATAGVSASEIEFAELYDCFTYNVLSQIEGYGFSEPGGVPEMLRDGRFDRFGGTLPINTHGGLLSEGYLHGLNHVYEAVQQIRGEAAHRQLSRHDVALVTGQLGYVSGYSSAAVLVGG